MAARLEAKKIRNRTEALEQLAELIETTAVASEKGGKGTLADYVRLVQLERELREENNESKVGVVARWIDNKIDCSND